MRLNSLTLYQFRNFKKQSFRFTPGLNLILGPNASGKTNLIEALYFLATAQSFRATRLDQLFTWGENQAFVSGSSTTTSWQVQLIKDPLPPQTRVKKSFFINKAPRLRSDYLSTIAAVLFRPSDLNLVAGSPSRRRQFLDQVLGKLNPEYQRSLYRYQRSLLQRNRLLLQIRAQQASSQELYFWDQSLLKNGQIIQEQRQSFFAELTQYLSSHPAKFLRPYAFVYQPSNLNSSILARSLARDINFAATHYGPHRDDFVFTKKDLSSPDPNLAHWGSRGQQRLAVLAFKTAEAHLFFLKTKSHPLILLDDIFSELDPENQNLILTLFRSSQLFLTSSQKEDHHLLSRETNFVSLPISSKKVDKRARTV